MGSISTFIRPSPPAAVWIEFDARGERTVKRFDDVFKARRFYTAKDRDGKSPKVVKGAKSMTKSAATKKPAKKTNGRGNMVTFLKAVAKLGGTGVAKAKIVAECAKSGMAEQATATQMYVSRHASPALTTRKKLKDGTLEFTITAAGKKLLDG